MREVTRIMKHSNDNSHSHSHTYLTVVKDGDANTSRLLVCDTWRSILVTLFDIVQKSIRAITPRKRKSLDEFRTRHEQWMLECGREYEEWKDGR